MESLYKGPLRTNYWEVRDVETLKFSKNRSEAPLIQAMIVQEHIKKNQHSVTAAMVQILYESLEQSSLHQSCWSKLSSGFLESRTRILCVAN